MALKTGKKSLIGFALREKVMLNPMTHNPFQTLEQHLSEIVRQRSQWLAENKGALDETTAASNRAAHSATACGGSDGAIGL